MPRVDLDAWAARRERVRDRLDLLLPGLLLDLIPAHWLGAPTPPATSAPAISAPVLVLPPVPDMPVKTIESSPPGARIGDTLRFKLVEPWVMGGVGIVRRVTKPGEFGLLADLRLGLPAILYGSPQEGWGAAPTISINTLHAFPDGATAGLAFGYLQDRSGYHSPSSAGVLMVEALFPFHHDQGARTGEQISLLVMVQGVWFGFGYSRIPTDRDAIHAVTLRLGLNFIPVVW